MTKSQINERRNFVRAKRILSIEYRLIKTTRKTADKNWHLSTTQDMSVAGLAFYSNFELKAGETIEMHIVMSGILEIFKGAGKVVRVEQKRNTSNYLIAVEIKNKNADKRNAKSYTESSPIKKRSAKKI